MASRGTLALLSCRNLGDAHPTWGSHCQRIAVCRVLQSLTPDRRLRAAVHARGGHGQIRCRRRRLESSAGLRSSTCLDRVAFTSLHTDCRSRLCAAPPARITVAAVLLARSAQPGSGWSVGVGLSGCRDPGRVVGSGSIRVGLSRVQSDPGRVVSGSIRVGLSRVVWVPSSPVLANVSPEGNVVGTVRCPPEVAVPTYALAESAVRNGSAK
jgi:hypothetical protein